MRFQFSKTGNLIYSTLVGAVGIVILAVFLGGVMALETLGKIMPWIVGFNGLLTGYLLVEKDREEVGRKRILAPCCGALGVIIASLFLRVMFGGMGEESPISLIDFMIYLVLGTVFSGLGALLAIKYFQLD